MKTKKRQLTRILLNKSAWYDQAVSQAKSIAAEKGLDPENVGLVGVTVDGKIGVFQVRGVVGSEFDVAINGTPLSAVA